MSTEYNKPPLGLMPKHTWIEQRIIDIVSAMNRYYDAKVLIPNEWVIEYKELNKQLRKEYDK